MSRFVEVTEKGFVVKANQEPLNARQFWDLQTELRAAFFEYKNLVGRERFREEMGFDPEKKG